MTNSRRPTAVLIDRGSRTDLGVARALGRGGVRVHLAGAERTTATSASRFVSARHASPRWDASDEAWALGVAAVLQECAQAGGTLPALLATGDSVAERLARTEPFWRHLTSNAMPSADVVAICGDKWKTQLVLGERGVPVPMAARLQRSGDLEPINGGEVPAFPVFVKPIRKGAWDGVHRQVIPMLRGIEVHSAAELGRVATALDEVGALPRTVVQSFVPGTDADNYTVQVLRGHAGQRIGALAARKHVLSPPGVGLGCVVETIADSTLIELGWSVVEALDYRGFADIDLKRGADGQWHVLEVNPRYSTWVELGSHAGVNFPQLNVCEPDTPAAATPRVARAGVWWVDASRLWRSLRMAPGSSRQAAVVQWCSHVVGRRRFAFFASDDWPPFIHQLRHHDTQ